MWAAESSLIAARFAQLAHERFGAVPWVLITGHGNEQIAVDAIKQGAFNYLTKPVDTGLMLRTLAERGSLERRNEGRNDILGIQALQGGIRDDHIIRRLRLGLVLPVA